MKNVLWECIKRSDKMMEQRWEAAAAGDAACARDNTKETYCFSGLLGLITEPNVGIVLCTSAGATPCESVVLECAVRRSPRHV